MPFSFPVYTTVYTTVTKYTYQVTICVSTYTYYNLRISTYNHDLNNTKYSFFLFHSFAGTATVIQSMSTTRNATKVAIPRTLHWLYAPLTRRTSATTPVNYQMPSARASPSSKSTWMYSVSVEVSSCINTNIYTYVYIYYLWLYVYFLVTSSTSQLIRKSALTSLLPQIHFNLILLLLLSIRASVLLLLLHKCYCHCHLPMLPLPFK